MASLDMLGPFALTDNEVSKRVPENVMGNYAFLQKKWLTDEYFVRYVGRSDSDLKREIKQQMKTDRAAGCTHFMFSIASTKKEAFEKECHNYHDFGGSDSLHNEYHPDKPDYTAYKCPVEGCEYHTTNIR